MVKPDFHALLLIGLCLLIDQAGAQAEDGATQARLGEARTHVLQQDIPSALAIWRELAEGGSPEARYQLAMQYLQGRHLPKDPQQGRHWLNQSAAQGHIKARYVLGRLLERQPGQADAALHWYRLAAAEGHRGAARALQRLSRAGDGRDERFRRRLHSAVSRSQSDQVGHLLARDADVSRRALRDGSLLLQAATLGHADILRQLLDVVGTVDTADDQDNTLLHRAVRNGHRAAARVLLQAGAGLNKANSQGDTPLMLAIRRNQNELVGDLLQYGADPAMRDRDGRNALDLAELAEQPALVKRLREGGLVSKRSHDSRALQQQGAKQAMQGEQSFEGWPALHIAAWRGQLELVKLNLRQGSDVGAIDPEGRQALHRAAMAGHAEVIELLLDAGASLGARDADGNTPLQLAAQAGHAAASEVLMRLDRGVRRESRLQAALDAAIDTHQDEVGAQLVQWQQQLQATSRSLSRAVRAGMTRTAEQLLAGGVLGPAELHLALREAAARGDAYLLGRLLAHGADPDHGDGAASLLRAALRSRNAQVADLLLTHQPALSQSSASALLIEAAAAGDLSMVDYLLQAGAEVDTRDRQRNTALMRAARNGHPAVASLLLQHGADRLLRNRDGDRALVLARRAEHTQVVEVLEQAKGEGLLREWF